MSVLLLGASLSVAAQNEPTGPIPELVRGRLQIVKPATDLQVATPNDVVLKVGNYQIKHVHVSWRPLFDNTGGWGSSAAEQPEATRASDGEAMISVHPPALGKYELNVDVYFEDNTFDVASTEVNVRLPDRNPEKFVLNQGLPRFVLDLDTLSKSRVSGLALYSGYDFPVEVDAASMQFSLQSAPGQSPVDFDPKTGLITASSYGQAVLTIRFGGFERKACINVVRDARLDAGIGGASRCADVVPGGLKWTRDELGRPSRDSGPIRLKPIKEQ